jgi:hypothetical protein
LNSLDPETKKSSRIKLVGFPAFQACISKASRNMGGQSH